MEIILKALKKQAFAIAFASLFVLFLILWLVSASKLSNEVQTGKASKGQIKQLQTEIKVLQTQFNDLTKQIQENEKNRPTVNSNADVSLDDLLRKMQDRFNEQRHRGLLDSLPN